MVPYLTRVSDVLKTCFMLREHSLLLIVRTRSRGPARQKIGRSSPDQPLELIEDLWIPPALGHFFFHGLQGIGGGGGLLVRSLRAQRVIDVYNLQRTRRNRDKFSLKSIGVSRTIELLVVVSNNWKYQTERL